MREVPFEPIVDELARLCQRIGHELPADVTAALEKAAAAETNRQAKEILGRLIENARLAADKRIPLCQDTGLTVAFVEQGAGVQIIPPRDRPDATIIDAVNDGIARGYLEGYLRKSIVAEPLNERRNTGTNTPAVVHFCPAAGDGLKITLMAKGGGCENKSRFHMFNPTETPERVGEWIVQVVRDAGANACPPFVVGVGLGGDFEHCCFLSKKALLRNIGEHHPDAFYAEMETRLLEKINRTGLGPQGLGGDTTALGVNILTAPCHIASLPAAVNIECHSHRHGSVSL